MKRRNVFMVSLNSKRLQQYLQGEHKGFKDEDETIVFVYDIFEILNGIFFEDTKIDQMTSLMDSIISKVREQIVLKNSETTQMVCFSQYQNELSTYLTAVYTEYFTNNSFKRHCKSQIFKNLQPKLREVQITNHKSVSLELLSPFLLAEIAYYLYIFHHPEYTCVYGLESEMEIIVAIKNGKYERLNQFITNPVPHTKVEF